MFGVGEIGKIFKEISSAIVQPTCMTYVLYHKEWMLYKL